MRIATWLGAAVWAGSWRVMYLEITRWHDVKPTLAFNPGPPIPGTNIRARPGVPLRLLYVACAAAPVVVTGIVRDLRERRRTGHSFRSGRR
ncbi:hypothetical protein ACFORO_20185 [Amycolatopsis halotolerans]|uniref:Uncharacterized protein n=1 Tax=Amycolatopsis halotolerans TaxID=330083 RepID=A0ABV7QKS5_9PSEU